MEVLELERETQYEYDSEREVVYVNALEIRDGESVPQHRIDLFFDDSSQEVIRYLLKTPGVTELKIKGSHVLNMVTGGTFRAREGDSLDPLGISDIDVDILGNPRELEFPESAQIKSKTISNRVVTARGIPMDIVSPAAFENYEIAAATELLRWLESQEKTAKISELHKRAKAAIADNENRLRNDLPLERAYYMHETLTVSAKLKDGEVTYTFNDPYNFIDSAISMDRNAEHHSRAATKSPSHTIGLPVTRVAGVKAVLLDAMELMSGVEVESPAYLHALEAVARSTKFSMENSIVFDFEPHDYTDKVFKQSEIVKKILQGDTVDMKGTFLQDHGFESVADVLRTRLQEMAARGIAVDQLGFYQSFVQELEFSTAIAPELDDLYDGVEREMLPTFADFARNSLDEHGKVPQAIDSFLVGVHNALVDRYKNYKTPLGRKFPRAPHETTVEAGLYKMAYAYIVAQESGVFTQEIIVKPQEQEFHALKLVQGEPAINVVDGLAMLLYSHNRYDEKTVESVVANWKLAGESNSHWSEHGTGINTNVSLAELNARIDYYKAKYPLPFADTHPLNKTS